MTVKMGLTAVLTALLAAAPVARAVPPAARQAEGLPHRGLTAALAERNLEKRSRKALENAEKVLSAARHAYRKGDVAQTQAALEEVLESVLLAHESLKQTGKDPARSPKHFKRAEIKTRGLLRRMDDFRPNMSFDDRETLDRVREVIDKVQKELLMGIMGGKKRK